MPLRAAAGGSSSTTGARTGQAISSLRQQAPHQAQLQAPHQSHHSHTMPNVPSPMRLIFS